MMKMKFLIFGMLFSVLGVYAPSPASGQSSSNSESKEKKRLIYKMNVENITEEHEKLLEEAEPFVFKFRESLAYFDHNDVDEFLNNEISTDRRARLVEIRNGLRDLEVNPCFQRVKIITIEDVNNHIYAALSGLNKLYKCYNGVEARFYRATRPLRENCDDVNNGLDTDTDTDTGSEGLSFAADSSVDSSPSTGLCRSTSDISEASLNS